MENYVSAEEFETLSGDNLLLKSLTSFFACQVRKYAGFTALNFFYPKLQSNIDERSSLRSLNHWLSPSKWLPVAALGRFLDVCSAWIVNKIFPKTFQKFPSWVHGYIFAQGSVHSLLFPWVPLSGVFIMDADKTYDLLTAHTPMEQAMLDLPSAIKTRLFSLCVLLYRKWCGENYHSFPMQLWEWCTDSLVHFGAIGISATLTTKFGWKWPYAYTCLTIPLWAICAFLVAFLSKITLQLMWKPVVFEGTEDELIRQGFDEGYPLLGKIPTESLPYLQDILNGLMFSTRVRHSVRLEALKFFRVLYFFSAGVNQNLAPRDLTLTSDEYATRTYDFEPMSPSTKAKQDSSHISCAICLGDYEVGDKLAEVACGHSYHTTCLENWLGSKHMCPTCGQPIKLRKEKHDNIESEDETRQNGVMDDLLRKLLNEWSSAKLPMEIENGPWSNVQYWARNRRILDDETLAHLADDFQPRFTDMTDGILSTFLWILDLYPESIE